MKRVLLAGVLIALAWTAPLTGRATITVCASGCTYTNSQLQTALDAAVAGDIVLLQEDTTYTGTFTMRRHGGASNVTVRTGVSSTGVVLSTSAWPAANVRATASHASTYKWAKLQANANNASALETANPSAGASPQYWHWQWVQFGPNLAAGDLIGSGSIITCGSDSNSVVTKRAEVPSYITFDRVYVAGHSFSGQFRGISVHCNNFTLINSTIEHIKNWMPGSEGQAVWINSSEGPYTITNNFLSGGVETFMSGGSSGAARPAVTVQASPAPTTTTFAVDAEDYAELRVGQGLTVEIGGTGTAFEQYAEVTSCGTSTLGSSCTSATITVSPAFTSAPAAGADVDWGLLPRDLTFTKNYVTRPLTMRSAILGTPQSLQATITSTGGTLAAGTHCYRVTARAKANRGSSSDNMARSAASSEVCATTTGSTSKIKISWAAVTNATEYRVYGRSGGGQNIRWTVTAPTVEFEDTGAAGTTEAVPTTGGTTFGVKNTFELKIMDGATIEGNVFENSWNDAQTGYLILFTPSSSSSNDSARVRNITFRYNIVRHGAGGMQLAGRQASSVTGNGDASGLTTDVNISHNLWYDINSSWGSSVHWLLVTTKSADVLRTSDPLAPARVSIIHNTIDKVSGALMFFDLNKSGSDRQMETFVFRDNLAKRATYGLTGNSSCLEGGGGSTRCWDRFTTSDRSWLVNVIAGATCGNYPSGTTCPTYAFLEGEYVDYANVNFALKSTSAYKASASDSTDRGADIAEITTRTNVAISGDNTGAAPVLPPSILTAELPNGTVGSPYSATIDGTCPAAPCTWSVTGAPDGLSLTTISSTQARLAGTPLVANTFSPEVTITSATPRSASRTYSVVMSIVNSSDPDTGVTATRQRFDYQDCASISTGTEPTTVRDGGSLIVCDRWFNTTTGLWYTVTATSPSVTWTRIDRPDTATVATITTAGAATYTATQMLGTLILRDPNGADRSDVTPTATQIIDAIPGAVVGSTFRLDIRNTAAAAQTITVTAGAGVTLSGTMTIAQNNTRQFRGVVTDVATPAVTLYSLGTLAH